MAQQTDIKSRMTRGPGSERCGWGGGHLPAAPGSTRYRIVLVAARTEQQGQDARLAGGERQPPGCGKVQTLGFTAGQRDNDRRHGRRACAFCRCPQRGYAVCCFDMDDVCRIHTQFRQSWWIEPALSPRFCAFRHPQHRAIRDLVCIPAALGQQQAHRGGAGQIIPASAMNFVQGGTWQAWFTTMAAQRLIKRIDPKGEMGGPLIG